MTGDGPHRSADFVEPCGDCSERAVDACYRCRRPFCAEHKSLDEDLCRDCDRDWLERVQRIESRVDVATLLESTVAISAPALGLVVAVQLGLGLWGAIIAVSLGLILGLPLGSAVARVANRTLLQGATVKLKRERVRFLEERTNARAAPSRSPEPSPTP